MLVLRLPPALRLRLEQQIDDAAGQTQADGHADDPASVIAGASGTGHQAVHHVQQHQGDLGKGGIKQHVVAVAPEERDAADQESDGSDESAGRLDVAEGDC